MKQIDQESNIEHVNYTINKYTLKCIRGLLIASAIVWLLNILGIFIIDTRLMTMGGSVAIAVAVITLLISQKINLNSGWVKYFLISSVLVIITAHGIAFTYHTTMLLVMPVLLAAQYTDKKILTFTYILSLVCILISAMGGYYWGLCDANMLLLTKGPTADYLNIAEHSMTFTNINPNPWYTVPVYYVVPRCILLTLLIPVITSISKNIRQYEEYALNMKRLGERDEMTGLFNRNKFLSEVQENYSKLDHVGVFFFDVNNLKWTNDHLGHDKGDELITAVGRLLLTLEGGNRKAYRIGGDEFILVFENPTESDPEAITNRWKELFSIKSKTMDIALSVAYGYACGKGKDINDIVETADQEMYKMKQIQKGKS